jgi:hypothetical protein
VPAGPSNWTAGEENATRPSLLVDKSGNPIRTDRSYDWGHISSNVPDANLYYLEQLAVSGPAGSLNLKVTGFARYKTADSIHGSVVVFYTGLGQVELDGEEMTFDESVAGAFTRAGFDVNNITEPIERRRRSGAGRGEGLEVVRRRRWSMRDLSVNTAFLTGAYSVGARHGVSDERLKVNIERVGATPSGIPTYTWNYVPGIGFDPSDRYFGTMAQALLEIGRADAVLETANHYYMVDYSRLDIVGAGLL